MSQVIRFPGSEEPEPTARMRLSHTIWKAILSPLQLVFIIGTPIACAIAHRVLIGGAWVNLFFTRRSYGPR